MRSTLLLARSQDLIAKYTSNNKLINLSPKIKSREIPGRKMASIFKLGLWLFFSSIQFCAGG